MNVRTVLQTIPGPAGRIACAVDAPAGTPLGVAVICHPHPQHGGTLDNKVVQTLARVVVQLGWRSVRFNFRGVGDSEGVWDEGRGEVEDALAVVAAQAVDGVAPPLLLAGFSFGGFVAAEVASRLPESARPQRLVLIGPSTEKQGVPAVPPGTVVIHGESDDVVPLSATLDWARPQALPVIVFPGVGHFFHGQLALLKQVLLQQMQGRPPA
ncbi:MAG: alpha/beta fold hydrolase [Burkholderiaceae bacterium]